MYFVKAGKGKTTLVFLHGWGGAWQSWAPIIERFKNKYLIYVPDLPGFGASPLPKAYTLDDYVLAIRDFLSRLKISRPVLIGHSFGGQVAAKFVLDYKDKLSGLVLVDSAVVRDNSQKMKANIVLALWGQRLLLVTPLVKFYPQIRKFYYQLRGWTDSDYFRIGEDKVMKQTASNIFRQDLSGNLKDIKAPTLVVWGERDENPLTSLAIGRRINQNIPNSQLVIIPSAGHFSYLENQELFCAELTKFIQSL